MFLINCRFLCYELNKRLMGCAALKIHFFGKYSDILGHGFPVSCYILNNNNYKQIHQPVFQCVREILPK